MSQKARWRHHAAPLPTTRRDPLLRPAVDSAHSARVQDKQRHSSIITAPNNRAPATAVASAYSNSALRQMWTEPGTRSDVLPMGAAARRPPCGRCFVVVLLPRLDGYLQTNHSVRPVEHTFPVGKVGISNPSRVNSKTYNIDVCRYLAGCLTLIG